MPQPDDTDVVGSTSSSNFPVLNPFQRTLRVEAPWYSRDAFVTTIVEAPPPMASITRSGNSVTISWPVAAAGFGLEASNSLTPAPDWTAEGTPAAVVGDQNVVTFEIGAGAKFFRLRKV